MQKTRISTKAPNTKSHEKEYVKLLQSCGDWIFDVAIYPYGQVLCLGSLPRASLCEIFEFYEIIWFCIKDHF